MGLLSLVAMAKSGDQAGAGVERMAIVVEDGEEDNTKKDQTRWGSGWRGEAGEAEGEAIRETLSISLSAQIARPVGYSTPPTADSPCTAGSSETEPREPRAVDSNGMHGGPRHASVRPSVAPDSGPPSLQRRSPAPWLPDRTACHPSYRGWPFTYRRHPPHVAPHTGQEDARRPWDMGHLGCWDARTKRGRLRFGRFGG